MADTSIPFLQRSLFIVYRPPINGDSIFDFLSLDIEYLLITDANCHVLILGGFTVHNPEWLTHSSDISVIRLEAEQLAVVNNSFHLIDLLKRIPDRSGSCADILHLMLSSALSSLSNISILIPLVSSNHCVLTPSISLTHHNVFPI